MSAHRPPGSAEESAAQARYEGAVLGGRYRLGRLLGEGGMGAVYAATLEGRPQERCAVKILHAEMAANPTVVERFLAEGDLCRRLEHPGILRVFDIGQQGGVPYLVMELLEGRALVEYTEHQQRLPLNFAVTVCAGVLHALDFAHARGIVHRDLKPENVFLVPLADGSGWATKILDFGIARCIDAAGGAKRRTATGVLLGTPGYMSPEQVRAARTADHRADLWAVGVMFYEMITGAPAFPSEGEDPNNVWGLLSAVLTRDPVPLSVWDRRLAPLEGFIQRALAKEPEQRFQSAREMSAELLRIARAEIHHGDATAQGASAFTREQAAVPIHSRGEVAVMPPLAHDQTRVPSHDQTRVPSHDQTRVPSHDQTRVPSHDQTRVPSHDQTRLAPIGGTTVPSAVSPHLAGTMPMPPDRSIIDYAGPQSPAFPGDRAYPSPNIGYGVTAPSREGLTALAPDLQPRTGSSPPPAMGATALADPHVPKYGTAPSGFRPQVPHVPTGPSPLEAPADEGDQTSGSATPWIVLGVILLVGLICAVFWLVH
jgi:serine/threonine-protein kinase